jgi:hypothetical protein
MGRTFRAALAVVASIAIALALTSASVAATAPAPRLSSQLIAASQLPSSWSEQSISGSVSAGCLANVIGLTNVLEARGVHQTSSAKVFFIDNSGVPVLSEMLATFSNPVTAYLKIVAQLTGCKHLKGEALGVAVSGTMNHKTLTHYGNASDAFSATTSVLGQNVDVDMIIVRKGDVVVSVAEGAIPQVNLHQFQGFVVKALAKVH